MRSTFSILPYINRNKVKADGTTAVLCRITIDGKSSTITTGIYCRPEDWNSKTGVIRTVRENNRLQEFKKSVELAYEDSLKKQNVVSADILKNTLARKAVIPTRLLQMGERELERLLARSKEINSTSTYRNSKYYQKYLKDYLTSTGKEDIDFTDILSYTSAGWTKDTYMNLFEGNVVQLYPDQPAELKFTIDAPNGALWRAALEGDVDAFEFVDGINSGNAYNEGSPQEQTIKIKVTDPESDERHEATLRVFADIAGKTYELDLTNPDREMEGGSDAINRFTLLQSR